MSELALNQSIEYLIIGHISLDITSVGTVLGGTAYYSSLTAQAMGLRVGLVTSWANNHPLKTLDDIILVNQPSGSTTTFKNIYTENRRHQTIYEVAQTLNVNSIPDYLAKTPIVHLAPIANEIEADVINLFPTSFVGVTPQGWLRSWDETGCMKYTEWREASLVLPKSQVAIISNEDVNGNESKIIEFADLCSILVVTEGNQGCRVFWHGDVRRFNVSPIIENDPTGAGDIFATAFIIQFQKTGNPWESARFANKLAGISVTRAGLESIPTKNEISSALSEVL